MASTDWKEVIPEGEAARLEQLASDLAGLQARLMARRGRVQRGLHTKPNAVARARFEVHAGLPEHLRVGCFAEARGYDAVVRFSNGAPHRQGDRKPDVRGVAVKVLGVEGKKVIPGLEHCVTQDFLGILHESVPFATPDDFVWFVVNAEHPLTLLPKAIARLGFGPTFALLGKLKQGLGEKLKPLRNNRYFSALPIRFGPYAAKFALTPAEEVPGDAGDDLGAQLVLALSGGALKWHFQVQLFENEQTTPIEDPTVVWNAPWNTVATLTLPQQTPTPAFTEWAEGLSFDPWHAHEALRPLGAMMRARNAAYRLSTQARKAAAEPEALPA